MLTREIVQFEQKIEFYIYNQLQEHFLFMYKRMHFQFQCSYGSPPPKLLKNHKIERNEKCFFFRIEDTKK